jgi:hypothetical protein
MYGAKYSDCQFQISPIPTKSFRQI